MARSLKDIAAEMRRIVPDNGYYSITFTADESGKIWWSAQSTWEDCGDDVHTEVRSASLVIPDKMAKLWNDLGQPFLIVNEIKHLYVYRGPVPRTRGPPAKLEMPTKDRRTGTCLDQFSATFLAIL